MDAFRLDDVRESFTADIGAAIVRIATAAEMLADAPILTAPALFRADDGDSLLIHLGHACHAIAGTASLVSVHSLAESARALEELASDHEVRLARVLADLKHLRAAVKVARSGADDLHRMLEWELAGRSAEAVTLATELRTRIAALGAVNESVESDVRSEDTDLIVVLDDTQRIVATSSSSLREEVTNAFTFEDSSAEPDVGPPTQSFDFSEERLVSPSVSQMDHAETETMDAAMAGELLEIFRQEVEELLGELRTSLSTALAHPEDHQAMQRLARIFHTLKGASATVGLKNVSDLARNLEVDAETLNTTHGHRTQVVTLAEKCDALLICCGLPPFNLIEVLFPTLVAPVSQSQPGSTSVTAGSAEPSTQLVQIFCLEAALTIDSIERILTRLSELKADFREAEVAELGRLFHLLKGSAVVAGESRMAGLAATLQDRCRAPFTDLSLLLELVATGVRQLKAWMEESLTTLGLDPATVFAIATPVPMVVSSLHDERPRTDAISRERSSRQLSATERRRDGTRSIPKEAVGAGIDPALWEAFEIEAAELIQAIDGAIIALIDTNQPKRAIASLFRSFHTLKGTVNTVGIAPLGRYLHRVEDFLDTLQDATVLPPMRVVVTVLTRIQASVRANLAMANTGYVQVDLERLAHDLALVTEDSAATASISTTSSGATTGRGDSRHDSHDSQDRHGSRSASSLYQDGAVSPDAAERRFVRVPTQRLDGLMNLAGELVVSRSRINRRLDHLRVMSRELMERKDRLMTTVGGFKERYEFNLLADRDIAHVPAMKRGPAEKKLTGSALGFSDLEMDRYEDINVLARSLNEIGDDIADLHRQFSGGCAGMGEDVAAFGRHITSLQGEITRTRMVPMDQLFVRLRLPLNDAATREKKEVRMMVVGGEVALDKTIVDGLYGPLLHLVRNAVSHGIEDAGHRHSSGKEAAGLVTLEARQESGQVVLTVTDDGHGLDLVALHRAGVARGLIVADTPLDDPVVRELVFVSGLSTRATASEVAGRGVGCDVVRREIEHLGGHVVVSTRIGQGTAFTITLPLTLAITRALLVAQDDQIYALPLGFAERIIEVGTVPVIASVGRRRLRLDDGVVSLRSLPEIFGRPADNNERAVVVLRVGEARIAVAVDRVLGQDEIVVKRLDQVCAGHPLFSGVTVSAEGQPILILDVPGLMERGGEAVRLGDGRNEAEDAGSALATPAIVNGPRRRRVLFVDDSLSVRKVAERFLGALDVDVVLAVDGVDALAKLRLGGIDLVFTDLEMPRMHGYDLLREIRYIPAWHDLPVVVVTSRSGQKHRDQATALGANDYLTKPFTQEVLAQVLATWNSVAEVDRR